MAAIPRMAMRSFPVAPAIAGLCAFMVTPAFAEDATTHASGIYRIEQQEADGTAMAWNFIHDARTLRINVFDTKSGNAGPTYALIDLSTGERHVVHPQMRVIQPFPPTTAQSSRDSKAGSSRGARPSPPGNAAPAPIPQPDATASTNSGLASGPAYPQAAPGHRKRPPVPESALVAIPTPAPVTPPPFRHVNMGDLPEGAPAPPTDIGPDPSVVAAINSAGYDPNRVSHAPTAAIHRPRTINRMDHVPLLEDLGPAEPHFGFAARRYRVQTDRHVDVAIVAGADPRLPPFHDPRNDSVTTASWQPFQWRSDWPILLTHHGLFPFEVILSERDREAPASGTEGAPMASARVIGRWVTTEIEPRPLSDEEAAQLELPTGFRVLSGSP